MVDASARRASTTQQIFLLALLAGLMLAFPLAAGTYWAVGPAVRCMAPARGPVRPGWSARTVVSGGRERCYYVYVPSGHDPADALPVVVSYHGFLSNPESQALITHWHRLADREGFLVVYPQGTHFPQRWNAGSTWGDPDVDDVQFFYDILDDLSAAAAVDRARVYVNGFSNGGGMTVRLGCEAADSVAALGTVAAAVISLENCSPSRPIPMMSFHGTADPIVPYEGGTMRGRTLPWAAGITRAPTYFLGAEEWVATWAQGNQCDPTPMAVAAEGDVQGIRYTGCDQDAVVILYTVEEGGHTWPGGTPIPAVGKTSYDINATKELWRFYQMWALDAQKGPSK